MADYIPGQRAFSGGQEVGQVYYLGQEIEFAFGMGTQILPLAPLRIWGLCQTRVVLASGEKWFEFGFKISADLTGNAATGWTDTDGFFRIEPEWSRDLINWETGKFVAAPVPVVTLPSGQKQYWSRAIRPVDSAIKSGQMRVSSGTFAVLGIAEGNITADSRNNPFTALTVAGAVKALGGFPYTMPTDAVRMTADLQPFYPGALVEATSAVDWRITLPGVNYTASNTITKVFWPQYLIADMFGNVNTPLNGASLAGSFVDPAGNSVEPKGFARLKITHGDLYPGYFPPT